MAIISPDSFNPLKRFVAVRLQQGVPLVDADWNELEDVRKFEVRAYLKWFVGDGVPEGTDGFHVLGGSTADDFLISTGVAGGVPLGTPPAEAGLRFVGRCLVDGMDVLIDADTPFRAQPLHISQPGAAALAALRGVPVVPELPAIDADLLVYLDVWERLVTAAEDAALIFDGIGTEGCARLKREWVVRWRNAATVPAPPDPAFLPGHSYYAIARTRRRAAGGPVTPSDVTDLRARRLLALPSTLIDDVLGTTADKYRRGEDRPALSLRTAINALLRGELPSSPDRVIAPDPAVDSIGRAFQLDGAGGLVAVCRSTTWPRALARRWR
jgi:hypothetical protein